MYLKSSDSASIAATAVKPFLGRLSKMVVGRMIVPLVGRALTGLLFFGGEIQPCAYSERVFMKGVRELA